MQKWDLQKGLTRYDLLLKKYLKISQNDGEQLGLETNHENLPYYEKNESMLSIRIWQ